MPVVAMVGTDLAITVTTDLSSTYGLFIGFFVGMFFWYMLIDFNLAYRMTGLTIVDKIKKELS